MNFYHRQDRIIYLFRLEKTFKTNESNYGFVQEGMTRTFQGLIVIYTFLKIIVITYFFFLAAWGKGNVNMLNYKAKQRKITQDLK